MSLSKKLQKWVENDLISAEQSTKIKEFEKRSNGGLFIKISLTIAGLLIGWGICLIIASNWDVIPMWFRLLGAFALYGLFIAGAYREQQKERSWLKEMFLVLCFLMIAALIGLIGQTFNLEGGWQSFALAWSLLGLPYVFRSRSRTFNAVWICLFLSGVFSGMFWLRFFDWLTSVFPWILQLNLEDYLIPLTLICVVFFTALDYVAQKIDSLVHKYTVLAESFGIICTIFAYYAVFLCGFHYMGSHDIMLSAIAHIVVLTYLAFRMSLAVRAQDASAFKRNAFAAEIYIFLIFANCFGNLLTTGIGFILGGLLIWGLIHILRKTSKYIKGMEIFND